MKTEVDFEMVTSYFQVIKQQRRLMENTKERSQSLNGFEFKNEEEHTFQSSAIAAKQ